MKYNSMVMSGILVLCAIATVIGLLSLGKTQNTYNVKSKANELNLFQNVFDSKPGIGVVKVYGTIMTETESDFLGISQGGSDSIVEKLDSFRRDERVKAVVLRVNSPGGTLGASQEIAAAVQRIRKDGKKVFVSMADMAASGGYYISAGADKIIANKGTITGSIGVISAALNFTELMKKYGVKMNVIKQGKNKDIFAYWRDMTDEERHILEELSENAYEQFLEVVSKGRNIPRDKLLTFADGRIMTGEQALKRGLIDELGGMNQALRMAANAVGLDPDNPHIITGKALKFKKIFEMFSQKSHFKIPTAMDLIVKAKVPILYYCPSSLTLDHISMLGD